MRAVRITCYIVAALLAAVCIVVPLLGASGFFYISRQQLHFSEVSFRLAAEQSVGPIFTLLFCLTLICLEVQRRSHRWWIDLVALIGPVYTVHALIDASNKIDLSHVFFNKCSGYAEFILLLTIICAVALLTGAILGQRLQSKKQPPPTN